MLTAADYVQCAPKDTMHSKTSDKTADQIRKDQSKLDRFYLGFQSASSSRVKRQNKSRNKTRKFSLRLENVTPERVLSNFTLSLIRRQRSRCEHSANAAYVGFGRIWLEFEVQGDRRNSLLTSITSSKRIFYEIDLYYQDCYRKSETASSHAKPKPYRSAMQIPNSPSFFYTDFVGVVWEWSCDIFLRYRPPFSVNDFCTLLVISVFLPVIHAPR